jgi:uncharacterized membrane protein YbhN (UPF0104 family)
MQYSYIPLLKKSDKLPVGFIIKSFFLVIIISYLFFEIRKEKDLLENLYFQSKSIINGKPLLLILIPLILVPFNWAAEALKWNILSRKVVVQTFKQSFIGVLSGLSLGFITPQSIGEYAGRIWQIESERRSELVGAILLGSLMQGMISLLFGSWGFLLLIYNQKLNFQSFHLSFTNNIILILIFLIIIFLSLNKYKISIYKFSISFYTKYLSIISTYTLIELIEIGSLSFLRYLIFTIQFIVVLVLFDINLPIEILFAGVSWIFAAKTIIPVFNFLSDIGVREFSAILFFSYYNVNVSSIIIASLLIWVINILIPTIAGSFLMFRMRVFRK